MFELLVFMFRIRKMSCLNIGLKTGYSEWVFVILLSPSLQIPRQNLKLATTAFFTSFPNLLFTDFIIIRRYVIWDIYGIDKFTINN